MNDLNRLLHDAADNHTVQPLDARELAASARRRVRNRRLDVAAGTVAVTLAAAAVATELQGGEDRHDMVDDPSQHTIYEDGIVPVNEVGRLCR